jgi:hypothetical protein
MEWVVVFAVIEFIVNPVADFLVSRLKELAAFINPISGN